MPCIILDFIVKEELEWFGTPNLKLDGHKTIKQATIGYDKNTHLFFSQDTGNDKGTKYYYNIPFAISETIIKKLVSQNYYLYETLYDEFAIKPYFDCDIKIEPNNHITEENFKDLLELFLDFIIDEIYKVFEIKLSKGDFAVLNSSRREKLSFHIIIQNKIYFKSMTYHKSFIAYLLMRFCNPKNINEVELFNKLSWNTNNGKSQFIFDTAPYAIKSQQIRLVNQSKKGSIHILKNESDFADDDLFIRLYNGVGDRISLDISKLNLPSKIQKSSVIKQSKDTNNNKVMKQQSFIDNGITLMEQNDMTYDDVEILPYNNYKKFLFLIPNTEQIWEIYQEIAFTISACGGTKEDFIEWAKLSRKFSEDDEVILNFNTYYKPAKNNNQEQQTNEQTTTAIKPKKNKKYTLATLYMYASIAHPAYFNQGEIRINKLFNPSFGDIPVITETCNFVSQEGTEFENDIFIKVQILILQAFLGRGKTTAIMRLLKGMNYKRILFLSSRVAFSRFIEGEFKASCYIDGELHADRLVMSMESMWKLRNENVEPYDCVIMDESEANLGCFSSKTMWGKQILNYNTLIHYINNSKQTIFADAFITQKTVDFCVSLNKTTTCIKNITSPQARTAIEIKTKDKLKDKMIEELKQNKNIFSVFGSLDQLNMFKRQIKNELETVVDIEKDCLFYSSTEDDKVFNTLTNIEQEWGNKKVIAQTTSNTVGSSFAPTTPHFDMTFLQGCNAGTVMDIFQSHYRVRHTTEKILYFTLVSKILMDLNKEKNRLKFATIEKFNEYNEVKKKLIIDSMKKCIDRAENLTKEINKDYTDEGFNIAYKMLTTEYKETPQPLKQILFNNIYANGISSQYYNELFLWFLNRCNYTIIRASRIYDDDEDDNKIQPIILQKNEQIDDETFIELFMSPEPNDVNHSVYDIIPKIDEATKTKIEHLINTKQATQEQKIKLQKFYFDIKVQAEKIPIYILRFYYDIWESKYSKHHIDNEKIERIAMDDNHITERTVLYNLIKQLTTGNIENTNLKVVKLEHILHFNRALGLTHSLDFNAEFEPQKISRKKIEDIGDYIHKNRKQLHLVFNMKDETPNATNDVKNTIHILNKIYKSWTGLGFCAVNPKGKRKTKPEMFIKKANVVNLGNDITIPIPPIFGFSYSIENNVIMDKINNTTEKINELIVDENKQKEYIKSSLKNDVNNNTELSIEDKFKEQNKIDDIFDTYNIHQQAKESLTNRIKSFQQEIKTSKTKISRINTASKNNLIITNFQNKSIEPFENIIISPETIEITNSTEIIPEWNERIYKNSTDIITDNPKKGGIHKYFLNSKNKVVA